MITSTPLPYSHEGVVLEGELVRDEALAGPLPGVLLFHEFMGPGAYMRPHAQRLARHGYAALLCDMYGAGVRPRTAAEGSAKSRIYRNDRQRMRRRARAGFDALAGHSLIDPARLFAVGFSFGGCTALELARSGAELVAAASFYGYLNTPFPCAPGAAQAAMLVLHGAHDKVVPMGEIDVFKGEMDAAGARYKVVVYPDAGHGFANETQPGDQASGSWYCAATCEAAWRETLTYFRDRM
jgi:dienelactone hydrolase